jgi:hypothetical protein
VFEEGLLERLSGGRARRVGRVPVRVHGSALVGEGDGCGAAVSEGGEHGGGEGDIVEALAEEAGGRAGARALVGGASGAEVHARAAARRLDVRQLASRGRGPGRWERA